MRGPEREKAEARIEKARRRDLQRLSLIEQPPGRVAGRGRAVVERVRQSADGSAVERRRRLRDLRRDRGSAEDLRPRRNLSRGA
jgi:hypothetical protein